MAIALSVAYTPTPLAAGTKLIIDATPQMSPGKNFVRKSDYRQLMVTAAAAASPANILSAYNTMFGALISGRKIFIKLTPVTAAGIRGEPVEASVIVS